MKYMTVKVPSDLLRALKIAAAQDGTTVTAIVAAAVRKTLKEREKK